MQRRLTLPPRISEPGQPGTESQVGYALAAEVKECTPLLMVTVTGQECPFRFVPLENSPQWSFFMKEFDKKSNTSSCSTCSLDLYNLRSADM